MAREMHGKKGDGMPNGLSSEAIMDKLVDLGKQIEHVNTVGESTQARVVGLESKVDAMHTEVLAIKTDGCKRGDQHTTELRAIRTRVDKIEQDGGTSTHFEFGKLKISSRSGAAVVAIVVIIVGGLTAVGIMYGPEWVRAWKGLPEPAPTDTAMVTP